MEKNRMKANLGPFLSPSGMTTLESADAAALKDLLPQDVQTLVQDSDSQLLGSGSCASVHAVSCEGRTCALKVAHSAGDLALRGELELLHRIGGAGGAPVPLAFCAESHALLMSFCGKEALRVYLRRGGLSLQHALSVALRVAERLQELHLADVVQQCDAEAGRRREP